MWETVKPPRVVARGNETPAEREVTSKSNSIHNPIWANEELHPSSLVFMYMERMYAIKVSVCAVAGEWRLSCVKRGMRSHVSVVADICPLLTQNRGATSSSLLHAFIAGRSRTLALVISSSLGQHPTLACMWCASVLPIAKTNPLCSALLAQSVTHERGLSARRNPSALVGRSHGIFFFVDTFTFFFYFFFRTAKVARYIYAKKMEKLVSLQPRARLCIKRAPSPVELVCANINRLHAWEFFWAFFLVESFFLLC